MTQLTTALTLKALEMALHQRPVAAGLLHHSDRGSQYGAVTYQQRLIAGESGLNEPSRQLLGQCRGGKLLCHAEDRAHRGRQYQTRQEARTEIFEYLEGFYNR